MRPLIKCPLCNKEDQRVLLRPHWSNKYYEFICGHCRLEFTLSYDENKCPDKQLQIAMDKYLYFTTGQTKRELIEELQNKVNNMSRQELLNRLEELRTSYN